MIQTGAPPDAYSGEGMPQEIEYQHFVGRIVAAFGSMIDGGAYPKVVVGITKISRYEAEGIVPFVVSGS